MTEKLFDCPKFVDEDREVRSMLVFWLDVISGLVLRMEMQDTQNIEGGCYYILAVAEHHPKELDIGPELEHQVGSRWVEVEQNDQLVGN